MHYHLLNPFESDDFETFFHPLPGVAFRLPNQCHRSTLSTLSKHGQYFQHCRYFQNCQLCHFWKAFLFAFAFAINWVVCTMHINVIGYWQCTLVLFHQISLQCSFPFVILKCLTDFFSAILVIYRLGCITFYLLPLFAEQALRSIFNISHSDSVTWKHQYIKANITSV